MTRKELASQLRFRASQQKLWSFIFMAIFGVWLIGGALLENLLHWDGSALFRQAYSVFGLIIFGAFCLAMVVIQAGVPCPHCKRRLFGISGQIAVATGICGYCGEKVFE
jgi:hypothetical protein